MADPSQRSDPGAPEPGAAISWDDLRAFLAVALHGSMNRAAQELGESQPTVGRRMRRLERRTGLALFQRGPNSLTCTPAADALLRALAPMSGLASALKGVMAAHAGRQDRPLRLSSTNSIAIFLSEHMDLLREAAGPRELVLLPTRRFVDVMQGEADLALRMRQVKPEPGLLSRKVADVAAAIYGHRDRPDLPMIILPPSRMFSQYRDLALREAERRGAGRRSTSCTCACRRSGRGWAQGSCRAGSATRTRSWRGSRSGLTSSSTRRCSSSAPSARAPIRRRRPWRKPWCGSSASIAAGSAAQPTP